MTLILAKVNGYCLRLRHGLLLAYEISTVMYLKICEISFKYTIKVKLSQLVDGAHNAENAEAINTATI